MSKVDAMRALREARAAAAAKAAPAPRAKAAAARTSPAAKTGTRSKAADPTPPDEQAQCGHRSMNGRSCTRDLGHAEKNHRYG